MFRDMSGLAATAGCYNHFLKCNDCGNGGKGKSRGQPAARLKDIEEKRIAAQRHGSDGIARWQCRYAKKYFESGALLNTATAMDKKCP